MTREGLLLMGDDLLVRRFAPESRQQWEEVNRLLRRGIETGRLFLSSRGVEEVAEVLQAAERAGSRRPLAEAEALLDQFPVLYPDASTTRRTFEAVRRWQLPWAAAELWALAAQHGLETVLTGRLRHRGRYGPVRAIDPLRGWGAAPAASRGRRGGARL